MLNFMLLFEDLFRLTFIVGKCFLIVYFLNGTDLFFLVQKLFPTIVRAYIPKV